MKKVTKNSKRKILTAGKNKSGFTLVEIIVTFALCAILGVTAISLISPIGNVFGRVENKSEAQMMAANLMEIIRDETSHADILKRGGNKNQISCDGTVITVNDEGYLTINGELEYPASYYNGKSITLNCKGDGENKIKVTMSVFDIDDRKIFSTTATLQPLLAEGSTSGYSNVDYSRDANKAVETLTGLLHNTQDVMTKFFNENPGALGRSCLIGDGDNYNGITFLNYIITHIEGNGFETFCSGLSDWKLAMMPDSTGGAAANLAALMYKVGDTTYVIYANGNMYAISYDRINTMRITNPTRTNDGYYADCNVNDVITQHTISEMLFTICDRKGIPGKPYMWSENLITEQPSSGWQEL